MIGQSYEFSAKDPQETLNYTFDWTSWLDTGDTISTATWEVGGLTVEAESNTTTAATILLSGGSSGAYTLRCRITTANGLTGERTALLPVRPL